MTKGAVILTFVLTAIAAVASRALAIGLVVGATASIFTRAFNASGQRASFADGVRRTFAMARTVRLHFAFAVVQAKLRATFFRHFASRARKAVGALTRDVDVVVAAADAAVEAKPGANKLVAIGAGEKGIFATALWLVSHRVEETRAQVTFDIFASLFPRISLDKAFELNAVAFRGLFKPFRAETRTFDAKAVATSGALFNPVMRRRE